MIASVGPGQTSYVDDDVDPNTTYYYQIIAFNTDAAGHLKLGSASGYSNIASAVTAPTGASYVLQGIVPVDIFGVPSSSMVLEAGVTYQLQASGNISQTLSGLHRGDAEYAYFNVDGVPAWRDKVGGVGGAGYDYGIAVIAAQTDAANRSSPLNKYPYWGPLSTDVNHTYSILVVGNGAPLQFVYRDSYYPDNTSSNAGDIGLTVKIFRAMPSAVGNLVATRDRQGRQINLAWTNNFAGATNVLVQRSENGAAYTTIATLPADATAYSDPVPSVAFNHAYAYQVIVNNGFGQSAPSNVGYAVLVNASPQVVPVTPQVAHEDSPFFFAVDAEDSDRGAGGLTYSISGVPASYALPGSTHRISINPATGEISWPAPSPDGLNPYGQTMRLVITVTDADGGATSVPMLLTLAPSLASIPHATLGAHEITRDRTTLTLGVTATDVQGGADIYYTWEAVSQPSQAGRPTFSANGTHDASQTVATLHGAGTYRFRVTMTTVPPGSDPYEVGFNWPGASTTEEIIFAQELGGVSVSPTQMVAIVGSSEPTRFTAEAFDQFNQPMTPTPAFTWSFVNNNPVGTINASTGAYLPPTSVTGTPSDTIQASATVGGITKSGVAVISVPHAPPQVPVIGIGQPDAVPINFSQLRLTIVATDPNHPDTDSHLIYTWQTVTKPTGAPEPVFSVNGTNEAKAAIVTCSDQFPFNYTFLVTVQNEFGLSTSAPLQLSDPRDFKQVALTPTQSALGAGKSRVYKAVAQDQFGRAIVPQPTFAWTVDGVAVSGVTGGTFTYIAPSGAGQHEIAVSAVVGTQSHAASSKVNVIPSGPPTMLIVSPGGSADGPAPVLTADAPVQIVSADPDGDAAPWQLWLVPADAPTGSLGTKLAGSAESLGELGGAPGTAATLHVATVPNGVYILQLKNAAGQVQDTKRVEIKTQLKLGNLTLPFTDMTATLPGGQTASVGRTYDSGQAGVKGEIGYGWSLDLRDAHLHVTQPLPTDSATKTPALRQGDLVSLTLPGGEQHTFAFVPTPGVPNPSDVLFGAVAGIVPYAPRFIAVDGSDATLAVNNDSSDHPFEVYLVDGRFTLKGGAAYNPAIGTFGNRYTLTTGDGTAFSIDATTGKFLSVKDANENETNFASAFAVSTSGNVVTVTNNANQLAKVVYTINNNGDLASVKSPTGEVTTYAYDANHRLTGIADARGVTVLTAAYDAVTGQLASLVNSNGDGAPIDTGSFNGVRANQTVTDPSGNKTETIYNEFGDVARTIETVADPVTKVVSGYRVTVGGVSRFNTDCYNPVADGVSLYGSPQIETHGLPFFVSGSDPTGVRYTASPAVAQSVITYDYNHDLANPLADPDLRMPIEQRSYLGTVNGKQLFQTTTMKDYVLGKPQHVIVKTDSVDAAGTPHTAVTSSTTSTFDAHGNLTQSKDELTGAVTCYTYTDGSDGLPKGLPLATYRVRTGGDPANAADRIAVSSNDYYTTTDAASGARLGKLKSGTGYAGDGTPRSTFYAYDNNGNAVLTWMPKAWHKSDGSGASGWTANVTRYDLAGRTTDTYAGTYLGTGALPFTVTQATATSASDVTINASLYDDATQAAAPSGATALHTGHTAYDADGQAIDSADPYGGHTLTTYDASGRAIRVRNADGTEQRTVYDAMGRAVWQTDRFVPANATLASAANVANATHTLYDGSGHAFRTERYQNVAITITADAAHAGLSTSNVVAPTGAATSTTQTWYDEQGRAIEQRDAAGLRTGTTYDDAGNVAVSGVLKSTAPDGGRVVANADGTTAFAYAVSDFEPTGTTQAHLYDTSTGKPWSGLTYTRSTDALGHHTDAYQRADGLTSYTVFDDGSFTESRRSNGDQPIAGFDYTPTIPAGGSETVEVAQRKLGDPIVATIRVYDRAGQLVDVYLPAVDDALTTATTLVRPHTHYEYDASGNEIEQVDANNHETDFAYDENGNEVSRTLPGGERETYAYDAHGRQVKHVDFDANVATSTYYADTDAHAGMLQQVVYAGAPSSGKATQTVAYTYDALGRQQTITDASGTTTDHYDDLGNLIEEETPEGVIHYAYELATGRHTETWTDFTDTLYGYDARGRLATVTVTKLNGNTLTSPLVTTYAYDLVGNKKTETLPSGEVTTYGYDALNRLTSVVEQQGTTTLFGQTYILNDDGTRHSSHAVQAQANGTSVTTDTTWAYDADGRLTGESVTSSVASESYSDTFAFDLVGNRIRKSHFGPGGGANETATLTYNADDQLVTQASSLTGTTTFAYDPNGSQLTSTNGTTYGYDSRNKMTSATVGGQTATYVYDDAGHRVRETAGGATTYYLTDENNPTGYAQPIEERASQAGAPGKTYLIGDRVFAQTTVNGAISYLLTDGHGSTQQFATSNGVVTSAFRYDAFGGAINFAPDAASTPFLFGGDALYDGASRLYLHGDGVRGRSGFRFVEDDEQGYGSNDAPLSLHRILYVGGNPVAYRDRSGHDYNYASQQTTTSNQTTVASCHYANIGSFARQSVAIASEAKVIASFVSSIVGISLAGTGFVATSFTFASILLQQYKVTMQQALDSARDLDKAEELALRTTTLTKKEIESLPIFFVWHSGPAATPLIWANDVNGLKRNPAWSVLNYNGPYSPFTAINRTIALATAAALGVTKGGSNNTIDEFPFASTREGGGFGLLAPQVEAVPGKENSRQGGLLSFFYRTQLHSTPGSFLVVLEDEASFI